MIFNHFFKIHYTSLQSKASGLVTLDLDTLLRQTDVFIIVIFTDRHGGIFWQLPESELLIRTASNDENRRSPQRYGSLERPS